jgi:hypothetical protein
MDSLCFGLGIFEGELVEEVHKSVNGGIGLLLDKFLIDNPGSQYVN